MAKWFSYRPLAPVVPKYADDGTRDICSITLSNEVGDFEVGLVGSSNAAELIRVTTLNSDGNLSPEQSAMVSRLANHMLGVLRVTHNSEASVLRWGENTMSVGSHGENEKPNLGVEISTIARTEPDIDGKNVAAVFSASVEAPHVISLIADSQDARLPLQYRYLSLYKILELEFRRGKKWLGLKDHLEKFEGEYHALHVGNKRLENLLHELRDKCAHIKTGHEETLGIVGIDHVDVGTVTRIMPLLRRIALLALEGKFPSVKFVIKEMP